MSAHHLVSLAKLAVESFVLENKTIEAPEDFPAAWEDEPRSWREQFLNRRSGTFVTIEKEKELRGCIGTYLPTQDSVAKEVIRNAIAAASKDYRFSPIEKEELSCLKYTVYVLSEPEVIKNILELDPKKYGILIKAIPIIFTSEASTFLADRDFVKSGLLLPDLKGIDTSEQQIEIACQKARIDPAREQIIIYRFTAEKYQ